MTAHDQRVGRVRDELVDEATIRLWASSIINIAKGDIRKQMDHAPRSAIDEPKPWFYIGMCPNVDVFCTVFGTAGTVRLYKLSVEETDRTFGERVGYYVSMSRFSARSPV
jgi:hypothetical protein